MALAWLSQHQQILGLAANDPEMSLCTCVRELFENALDACESAGEEEHTINVAVTHVVGVPGNLYRVQISDDGIGFREEDIVDRICEACSSTKSAHAGTAEESSQASAGIFGLGLKTALLWAHTSGGGGLSVSTTTSDSQHVLCVNVQLARQCNLEHQAVLAPVAKLKQLPKPQGARCGTRITVTLSGGVGGFARLREYFYTVKALWVTTPLHLKISLGVDEPLVARISPMAIGAISDSAQVNPTLPGALLFLRSSLPIDLIQTIAREQDDATSENVSTDAPTTLLQAHGSEGTALDGDTFVHATALLLTTPKMLPKRPNAPLAHGQIGLWVLLFLNNKPLRFDGSLYTNCAGAKGLRKSRYWRELGLSMRAADETRAARLVSTEGKRHMLKHVALCVHVRSPAGAVRFADLTKSWLSADNNLSKKIGSALDGALAEAHRALSARGVLLSKAERKEAEARENAARITASVSNLLARCSMLPNGEDDEELLRSEAHSFYERGDQDVARIELCPAAFLRFTNATADMNTSSSDTTIVVARQSVDDESCGAGYEYDWMVGPPKRQRAPLRPRGGLDLEEEQRAQISRLLGGPSRHFT